MNKYRITWILSLVVTLLVACVTPPQTIQIPTNDLNQLNQSTREEFYTPERTDTIEPIQTPEIHPHSLLLLEERRTDIPEAERTKPGLILDISESNEFLLDSSNIPVAWSPSGSQLLLTSPDRLTLYLADADGKNPHKIMEAKITREGAEITGWWLSDNVILVQNWGGFSVSPSVYRYFIDANRIDGPYEDMVIQAVSTDGMLWIQMRAMTGTVDIVNLDNSLINLSGFDHNIEFTAQLFANITNQTIVFTPGGKEIFFIGKYNKSDPSSDCHIYKVERIGALISTVADFYTLPCNSILSVSPNGNYLAIVTFQSVAEELHNFVLTILNLMTREVIAKDSNSSIGPVYMLWSPDSQSVAYNIFGGNGEDYRESIVLFDLLGKSQVLYTIKGDLFLKDWKFLRIDLFQLAEHNSD